VFSGRDTATSTQQFFNYAALPADSRDWLIGLGHRRLSIIDLSPNGHQPMLLPSQGLTLTFNGEIYNYIEIREELVTLGHQFHTGSDTEVILRAWAEWGTRALHKFNGMFAFVILDTLNNQLFAVRDRFGVKPLYYTQNSSYLAIASEVKQLRELPEYRFQLNEQIAYDYLRYGLIDHAASTFEQGIEQVMPGHFLKLNLTSGEVKVERWYELTPQMWQGTEQQAYEKFYALLKDSVRLRLRSDVPVGSALSGGLDSSAIVCLMRGVLQDQGLANHPIETITSCFEDKKYDEWHFAEEVVKSVGARAHRVYPTLEKLQVDLDNLLWHMDHPFGSTSQFSQWCVFEEARRQGLTVMIDGQGADEQLAGYGGNDLALYAGLLAKHRYGKLAWEASSYRQRYSSLPWGLLFRALEVSYPRVGKQLIPKRYRLGRHEPPEWLRHEKFTPFELHRGSLTKSLMQQIQAMPLPALLRYEDRNSMAFSVESRVPFMDYRLIEFTLGLPEELIYRRGERKYLLRTAFRGVVPDKILDRKDKMGFVSPEERWFKSNDPDWFRKEMPTNSVALGRLLDIKLAKDHIINMQHGTTSFDFSAWRILCLNRWLTKHQ
ncbi:MAG: asparagine synthase (glutamine-hydrolyzing), partial [Cyclobacteriaceae bacterium]